MPKVIRHKFKGTEGPWVAVKIGPLRQWSIQERRIYTPIGDLLNESSNHFSAPYNAQLMACAPELFNKLDALIYAIKENRQDLIKEYVISGEALLIKANTPQP